MKPVRTIASMIIAALVIAQTAAVNAADAAPGAAQEMMVNLNEASLDQLEALPNIGPSKAQAILSYRTKRPFKKVEDLMRVKGIGRKTFIKLRPYLTVKGATVVPKKK